MALKRLNNNRAYGIDNALQSLAPQPIIAQRAPTASDIAEVGTLWVDQPNDAWYVLTSVVANAANWEGQSAGTGTFTAVTVNPGDLTVTAGNATIGGTLGVTGATTLADVNIVGNLTMTGDFDITDTASISLTSTNNAAQAIYLHANGGVSETIDIHSDQGTGVDSVNIRSDVGGITIAGGLATADAINLTAASGGIDMDSALLTSITSSRNNAQAILLEATAGGIDILASGASAGEDIDIIATGSSVNITSTEDVAQAIYIRANAGTSETVQIHADQGTGVASINVLSDVGGITLRATGLASADAINLEAPAGGIDADAALQINIASSQAAVDAIRLVASGAAGGIDIDAGTGGITIDSTGAISLDAAAASNFTATGAFDVTVSSTAGSVVVSGGEAVVDAVQLTAGNAAGGVTIATGTGGLTVNSTNGAIALNSGTAAINIGTDAAAHTVTIGNGTGATSVVLNAGTGAVNIGTNAVAHTTTVGSTTGASATVIQAGTGEIQLSAAGAVSMVPATATAASPTASVTINARVGVATFTGFTSAAGADQTYTITNSALGAGDGVFVTVSNRGTNDARIFAERVNTQTAGSLVIDTTNGGAAALNGDVIITFWIIN